jgi:hypothetical protein
MGSMKWDLVWDAAVARRLMSHGEGRWWRSYVTAQCRLRAWELKPATRSLWFLVPSEARYGPFPGPRCRSAWKTFKKPAHAEAVGAVGV